MSTGAAIRRHLCTAARERDASGKPFRVAIVGGVAGGATAAARLRRLSERAEIVIFEAGPYVSWANCGLPYHVGGETPREKLILQSPEKLHARYNLDVRVNNRVTKLDAEKQSLEVQPDGGAPYNYGYDFLLLSPGSRALVPPIPGIDHPCVLPLRTVDQATKMEHMVAEGKVKRAIVLGGGFVGLEAAEALRRRGCDVTVVEMLPHVMPHIDDEMATLLHHELSRMSVDLRVRTRVSEVKDDGSGGCIVKVTSEVDGSVEEIEAQLVVLAAGVRPRVELAKQANLTLGPHGGILVDEGMRTSNDRIYAVGDAVEVRDCVLGGARFVPLAGPANRQARIAADHIIRCVGSDCSEEHKVHAVDAYVCSQGTSIVRVGKVALGTTGATERELRRAQQEGKFEGEFEKVFLMPTSHVTYYEGAVELLMKVIFRTDDGRLLGAQILGSGEQGGGVARRTDIIAAVLRMKGTVFDLEEMELSYSPPFGAAKDPINMAGFIAADILRGDSDVIHGDQLAREIEDPNSGIVVVDVRGEGEFNAPTGNIPTSRLLPVDNVREHSSDLNVAKDANIVVYCRAGLRGYIAQRVLRELGYTNVRNLSGGYMAWTAYQGRGADLAELLNHDFYA